MTFPVAIEVCQALMEQYLSGYRGYPNSAKGVRRFAEAVQANAISVEHAEAFLQVFDDVFPTVRQIHDSALNCRPRFEQAAEEAQQVQWRREYGDPAEFQLYPSDRMAMHWQALRDALYYTEGPGAYELLDIEGRKERGKHQQYWDEAQKYNFENHAESVEFVRAQAASLGWPALLKLKASPTSPFPYREPVHRASARLRLHNVGKPITQADIDAAAHKRKSTAEVDRELDGWDDPDR